MDGYVTLILRKPPGKNINMLHLLKPYNTLTMTSTLFPLFALLFVGVCGARNATSTGRSSHDLPTFFSTTPLQNKIMTVWRLNHGRLFFQIPTWIKEERVNSSGNVTTLSFGDSLLNMSRNALFTALYSENKRETFHPLDSKMIQTTLHVTNRTRSQMPYLKKYSRNNSHYLHLLMSGGKLDIVWRDGLNASAENKFVSVVWKFVSKVNAFPHDSFLSWRSLLLGHQSKQDQLQNIQTMVNKHSNDYNNKYGNVNYYDPNLSTDNDTARSPHRRQHYSWMYLHSLFHFLLHGQLFRTLTSGRLFMLISLTLVSALILAAIPFVTNKSTRRNKRTNARSNVKDVNINSISEVNVQTKNIYQKKKTKKVTENILNMSKNNVVVVRLFGCCFERVVLVGHISDAVLSFTSSSPNIMVQKKMSKKKKSIRNRKKRYFIASSTNTSTLLMNNIRNRNNILPCLVLWFKLGSLLCFFSLISGVKSFAPLPNGGCCGTISWGFCTEDCPLAEIIVDIVTDRGKKDDHILKYGPMKDWDMSQVTNMDDLFNNLIISTETMDRVNVSEWDTSKVTTMQRSTSFLFVVT